MSLANLNVAMRAAACMLLCLVTANTACAQDRLDPVAMGKARASAATARGLGAIASNPGGLDFPVPGGTTLAQRLTFSLYNIGGVIGSTYLSSSDFQQIFGNSGGWPNQDERQHLGELLQDERLFANGANNLLTARYSTPAAGTFGLHYGHRALARLNFPDDFSRVIAKGELLADQYRFINRGVGGMWFTELGLSYGKQFGSARTVGWFPQVGIGATAKLLSGVAHFEVNDNSYIAVDQKTFGGTRAYVIQGGYIVRSAMPEGLNLADALGAFEAAMFPPTSGSGLSADVGISGVLFRRSLNNGELAVPRDAIYFGLVVSDLGSIRWTDRAYERSQIGINDTLFNGTLSNDQFKAYQGTLKTIDGYTTNLPSTVRAAVAVDVGAYAPVSGTLIVELEGELPLNRVPGNADDPRLALGADWGISNTFAVRGGISGGGVSGFGVGLGLGVRPLDWLAVDIGSSEVNGFFSGERVDLAFRLSAGF